MEQLLLFHCSILIDYKVFSIIPKKAVLFFYHKRIKFTFCDSLKWLHQAHAANAEMRQKQTWPVSFYIPVSWKQMEWEAMLTRISQQPNYSLLTFQRLFPEYLIDQ